jgi:hypothetical protein
MFDGLFFSEVRAMLGLVGMTGTFHHCSNLEGTTAAPAVPRTFLTKPVLSIRVRQVQWVGRTFQPTTEYPPSRLLNRPEVLPSGLLPGSQQVGNGLRGCSFYFCVLAPRSCLPI